MKKMTLLLAFIAVLAASGAFASEVVLTSVGQSPDSMMVRVVLRKIGVDAANEPLLRPEGLGVQKVLVAVVGGSSKGLGAAGINKEQEVERVASLFKAAREKNMKILVMHIGGEGRRGTLSDAFIDAAAPWSDRIIVVDGGNSDKIFDRLVQGKNVQILTAQNVSATADPLKATLAEWGISAR